MIDIIQMPAFKKVYKKLNNYDGCLVDDAIYAIARNPKIGEEKKGDLRGILVHKFKIHHQEMLIAYHFNDKKIILMFLGPHENFYRDLKRK